MIEISKAYELWNRPVRSIIKEEKQEASLRRVARKVFRWEEGTSLSSHLWLNFWVDYNKLMKGMSVIIRMLHPVFTLLFHYYFLQQSNFMVLGLFSHECSAIQQSNFSCNCRWCTI